MSERRCSRCETVKPLTEFNRSGNGHQWWCRECFRAYFRARGATHLAQVKRSQQKRRAELKRLVRERMAGGCVDCGERDPDVLEFHHVGAKRGDVNRLVASAISMRKLREELDGCQVLCANCHRRRTAELGGWRRVGWRPQDAATLRRHVVGRNFAFIYGALSAAGCCDCGEDDLVVLEFDHVGPKRSCVTDMARAGVSLATLKREMARCEVRCVNCHRRMTARRSRSEVQSSTPP